MPNQRWTTINQINKDLPSGCRAEKEQLMKHFPVTINIYDSDDNLIFRQSTGETSVKKVLASLERCHAHKLNLKSNK